MLRPRLAFTATGLLVCLLALPALAQDRGSVTGRVIDKKSGHALPFASVSLPEAKKGGLTDSEGRFVISAVPVGTYELKVQFLGYAPISHPGLVVTANKATVMDFQMVEIVVRQEKEIEVTAERRLVEAKQGTTIRSVSSQEIRNLPVQSVTDVLQQQAGITQDADQIHVRGGRSDETVFVVNGVTNRDLVTGASTAGTINARSVSEVNVATGAFDVRYGNALSGVVDVRLKEGSERFDGGITLASGSYGANQFQIVAGGPLRMISKSGNLSGIIDLSGSVYETRFRYRNLGYDQIWGNIANYTISPPYFDPLKSSYEGSFFGKDFKYGSFFSPSQDNRWAARVGLTWKPGPHDKFNFDFSKRIAIDQGFSRTQINAAGDAGDPAYPWVWDHQIAHAGTFFEDNLQTSGEWRRTLGTTGFTSVQLSRYFFAQREDVLGKLWPDYVQPYDPALPDPRQHQDFWIDSGDDNTWQDRRTNSTGIQWNLVQRFRPNELEVGLEHQFQSVQYLTIQDPWVFDKDGLGDSHDLWNVHPWVGDVYVRDRLDYEGFTANFGLRMDYWFMGREVEDALADTANANIGPGTRTEFYQDTKSFFGRRYKMKLSPRVIVAFPITENSSFFFNYGQFTQIPSYRYVYSKLTSISSESFPLLGNPNLNPQTSINYEVGAKGQFLPTAAINASVFVKDVYDYPTATTVKRQSGTDLSDVLIYLNGHFARAKGFEIEVEKRRSNYWTGRVSYTFSQTKGKSSDANEAKVVQETGGDASETRLSETFVRWNRPHKLAINFDMRFDEQSPKGWLKHSGINVYVQGQSGRAYTPVTVVTTTLPNGTQESAILGGSAEPYSSNAPTQFTTDLRLNHYFNVGGRRLDLSLQGTNIFNAHIINRVDPATGKERIAGEGVYIPSLYATRGAYQDALNGDVYDPSNLGPGGQWKLQVDYDF